MRVGLSAGLDQLHGVNPRAYPMNAGTLKQACGGYGTWSAAWLCDEASGSLQPVFGSPALAAVGSPVYGNVGPLGGSDKAIESTAVTAYFTGGTGFNPTSTEDLAVVMVYRTAPLASSVQIVLSGSVNPRWALNKNVSDLTWRATFLTAGGATQIASVAPPAETWVVMAFALDRATGNLNIAHRVLSTGVGAVGTPVAVAAETITAAGVFRLGQSINSGPAGPIAFAAVAVGSGVAAGIPANIAAICASFSQSIGGL